MTPSSAGFCALCLRAHAERAAGAAARGGAAWNALWRADWQAAARAARPAAQANLLSLPPSSSPTIPYLFFSCCLVCLSICWRRDVDMQDVAGRCFHERARHGGNAQSNMRNWCLAAFVGTAAAWRAGGATGRDAGATAADACAFACAGSVAAAPVTPYLLVHRSSLYRAHGHMKADERFWWRGRLLACAHARSPPLPTPALRGTACSLPQQWLFAIVAAWRWTAVLLVAAPALYTACRRAAWAGLPGGGETRTLAL